MSEVTETGPRAKRAALVKQIADQLLAEGVAQIPLRDLAAKLGTSDRMLLYYFDDKADLVRSSLREISSRLAQGLDVPLSVQLRKPGELLGIAVALFASEAMTPFMNVWADVTARGGRDEEPFKTFARQALLEWLDWLEGRLDMPAGPKRRAVATAILAIVEGARLLEISIPGSSEGVMEVLSLSSG